MKLKTLLAAVLAALAMTSCSKSDNNPGAGNNATAVLDNIMTRSSVRQFTSEPVAADTLETIVKAGMAAPTAMNKQPWEFVVVTERAALDSLMAVHPYSNLQTATAAIIVCGNMQKAIEGTGRDFWVQDCSAATENILLAAHACGLGAVWCGVWPEPERAKGVSRVLGLPGWVIPLNVIAMGHPAAPSQPKDKFNPANIHLNRW